MASSAHRDCGRTVIVTVRIVAIVGACVLLAGCEPKPKEEDPGWDCETQGNQVCGPSDENLTMEAL